MPTDVTGETLDEIAGNILWGVGVEYVTAEEMKSIRSDMQTLLALARDGLTRLDVGITTNEPIRLAAFQSEWLIRALQAGDTITLNGVLYTSDDGSVWKRDAAGQSAMGTDQ